ncbi:MAG: 3' terminal RNA ribose 2'-O-methyltransferase Hen1 [Hamadaea sp.]|uniref:3' terminal RNA ribose 2'-O-methyltransferase Hen1 n=1 Tax=Hamadaea sp. TaxID=2024425 RepID=UPI00181354F8|nr:3' terminal RNA ribose 2'-O-methyltransferase Hen1 [Hamadaea sp.]NUR73258.1 3' terminal RNA ribose 2'-O-methyltransferase Hen1 [Hamadaea sp.]NUT22906.1 3' terminal RNA ribose 2'-O-methyltransferase Hen1 [Hamadaea sp.]
MLLTITMTGTPETPGTDLGYLLVKHPDRVHRFDLPWGEATVLFPEATPQRCTAALLLEVDPQALAETRKDAAGQLNRYVNDRAYAASSLLVAAMNRAFRSAMRGSSKDRPELAETPVQLEIRVPVLRCKGGPAVAERLFAPLGWVVEASSIPLDEQLPEWGTSRYADIRLTGRVRLADALNHLYVLLPVLDDAKHYWVAPDEIEKLLRAGDGWLATHPERALITRRYLVHSRALTERALNQLATDEPDSVEPEKEEPDEKRKPLNAVRRAAVLAALADTGATKVLDLGCGPGALIGDLLRDRRFTQIVGADVSPAVLEIAARRIRLDRLPDRQKARIKLIQSALTYRDDRLRGYDAAVLMEVIEHVDEARLPALEDAVFAHAQPGAVVVTTPNVEYNVRYESLPEGSHRHGDHRFEWTRAQFAAWAGGVSARHGYRVEFRGVGDDDPEVGTPTQLALFTKEANR